MPQSLDVPSRFTPPDFDGHDPDRPPHLVHEDEWLTRQSEIAADNFTALAAFRPDWTDVDFHSREEASVNLTFVLPRLHNPWQYMDGRGDVWHDPDFAYDVRSDLVAHLERCLRLLKADIQDRPELKG